MKTGKAAIVKTIFIVVLLAVAMTYISMASLGKATVVCGNLGEPIYCPVVAAGFPFPFLADNPGISPVGSVARDPLWILIGEDQILWMNVLKSFSFWLITVALLLVLWHKRRK